MSDRVFILNYIDNEAVGIYSLGFRLANIAPVLSTALMTAYTPVFFELANKIKISENKRSLEKYNIFITLFSNTNSYVFIQQRPRTFRSALFEISPTPARMRKES